MGGGGGEARAEEEGEVRAGWGAKEGGPLRITPRPSPVEHVLHATAAEPRVYWTG